jgi:hypothetical protein
VGETFPAAAMELLLRHNSSRSASADAAAAAAGSLMRRSKVGLYKLNAVAFSSLKAPGFNPRTYEVKSLVSNVAFKVVNFYRCSKGRLTTTEFVRVMRQSKAMMAFRGDTPASSRSMDAFETMSLLLELEVGLKKLNSVYSQFESATLVSTLETML